MAREPAFAIATTALPPPVVYPSSNAISATLLPPVVAIPNYTYACTFLVLRQANPAYDTKTSEVFRSAFRMIQSA
ncbi:hypothetical protein GCK32_022339, partial [Trichostrongylus colubriformis]